MNWMTDPYFLIPVGCIVTACGFLLLGLMSITFTRSAQGQAQGTETVKVEGLTSIVANPTILKAQAGTLTTRTSGTAGTFTLGASHGITTGSRVDVYWDGGSLYGATVGTVAGTSVPITAVEGGDALPITTTAVRVAPCARAPMGINDNVVKAALASMSQPGYVVFHDGTDDLIAEYIEPTAPFLWKDGDAGTSPFDAKEPTRVYMSVDYTTGNVTSGKVQVLVNNAP